MLDTRTRSRAGPAVDCSGTANDAAMLRAHDRAPGVEGSADLGDIGFRVWRGVGHEAEGEDGGDEEGLELHGCDLMFSSFGPWNTMQKFNMENSKAK